MGNAGKPVVLVFAGPNGPGKTTVTRALSPFGTHVNADDLKRENGSLKILPDRHWPESDLRKLLGL